MNRSTIHKGGCLCGAVRYEVRAAALQTSLCHCEDCRRSSGAPFQAWTFFPSGHLIWIEGKPKTIVVAGRHRRFCGDCGSPLEFHDPAYPGLCEMNTCSFDDPSAFPPTDQCWIDDEIPWVHGIMKLSRFHQTSPPPG